MADALTPEEIAIAQKWLKEKWGEDRSCPMCNHPNWILGAVARLLIDKRVSASSTRGYPLLPVICVRCGYTALVNAILAGLQKAEDPEAGKPQEESITGPEVKHG